MFFTPYKAENPLQGMDLLEKEKAKEEKHIKKPIEKSPKIKSAYA